MYVSILTHLLRYKEVGLVEKKQLVFSSFLLFPFHKRKTMFSELNSDINCSKSSLIHLTGQPYCKRIEQQKDKDGIIIPPLESVDFIQKI